MVLSTRITNGSTRFEGISSMSATPEMHRTQPPGAATHQATSRSAPPLLRDAVGIPGGGLREIRLAVRGVAFMA